MKNLKYFTIPTILALLAVLVLPILTLGVSYADVGDQHRFETLEATAFTRINNETVVVPASISLTFEITDYFKRLTTTKMVEGTITIGEETYMVDEGWAVAVNRHRGGIKAFAEGWTSDGAHFVVRACDIGKMEDGRIKMRFVCGFKYPINENEFGWYIINGTATRYKLELG